MLPKLPPDLGLSTLKKIANTESIAIMIFPLIIFTPYTFGIGEFKLGFSYLGLYALGVIYIKMKRREIQNEIEYVLLIAQGKPATGRFGDDAQ